jgi:hypothetical protein
MRAGGFGHGVVPAVVLISWYPLVPILMPAVLLGRNDEGDEEQRGARRGARHSRGCCEVTPRRTRSTHSWARAHCARWDPAAGTTEERILGYEFVARARSDVEMARSWSR